MQNKDDPKPVCPKCGSGSIVVRKDKSILCRRCGNDTKGDKK
jgi:ribosomal protein S27AE